MSTGEDTFRTENRNSEPFLTGQFGKYQVLRELSAGGMGSLFLARTIETVGFEKFVVLKTIHPHLAKDAAYVDMFFDEARIAARIIHPNVCPVFDMGELDGVYFMAMEYLVGEPLHRVARALAARDEPLTELDVAALVTVVTSVAEGLHAAHELRDPDGVPMNVVHRDVCMQNIILTFSGNPRLIDFGIAKAATQVHQTKTGTIKGHFHYMSPEQIYGRKVDRTTDIWALGVVLWQLLARKRLFEGSELLEIMNTVVNHEITRPSDSESAVCAQLDQICFRALQRDKAHRYQAAREMADDLRLWMSSTKYNLGMNDIADWMAELMPTERASRLTMLRSLPPPPMMKGGFEATVLAKRDSKDGELKPHSSPKNEEIQTKTAASRVRSVFAFGAPLLLSLGAVAFAIHSPHSPGRASKRPAQVGHEVLKKSSKPADVAPVSSAAGDASETVVQKSEIAAVEPAKQAQEGHKVRKKRSPKREKLHSPSSRTKVRSTPKRAAIGSVRVVGIGGWAAVYHQGKKLGNTPIKAQLPTGTQTLELRPNGTGEPKKVRVSVTQEKIQFVRVPLVN